MKMVDSDILLGDVKSGKRPYGENSKSLNFGK